MLRPDPDLFLLAQEQWLDGDINPRVEYTYDTYGNRLTEKNARNYTTTTDYDPTVHTYPISVTNAKDHVQTFAYDYRFGEATAVIDPNNLRTEFDYDPFGRLIETRQPDGGRTTIQYFDSAAPRYVLSSVLESVGADTIDTYVFRDGLERKIETIAHGYDQGPQTVVTQWHYDNMGRNNRTNGPFFGAGITYAQTLPAAFPYTERTYDGRGRILTEISPDGEHDTITTGYAYSGFSTTITDPDAAEKIERKDYLGRIVEVNEFAGNDEWYTTTYDSDAAGGLLTVVNHLGHTTSITYDTLGRKLTMDDPDMGYWSYTYDPNGNMLTQTDAKSQTITFSYDELDRVLTKTYSTPDPMVDYTYDQAVNGVGRLASISNTAVAKTIDAYDEMGRETSVSKTFEGAPTVYTTEYSYDLAGRLSTLVHPDDYQVNYTYHPKTSLIQTVVGITDFTDYALVDTYEPSGKIGRLVHGNGVETQYTYDTESTRLAAIQTTDLNAFVLQERAYNYTPAGDISQITLGDVTHVYTYDKLHRLTSEITTGGEDTFAPESLDMSYNDMDHVHAVSDVVMNGDALIYEYDANGNMIQGPDFTDPGAPATRIIEYNPDNMPVQITTQLAAGSIQTDVVYDGESKRAKKTTEGASTLYINENYEVVGGGAIKYIFAGNLRVAEVSASGVMHYHKDHLGSTMVMTDSGGVQKEQTEHLPFGGLRNTDGIMVSPYRFTDQELDTETGLYNYDARLYDPVGGRFISADSIVPDWYDPQMLDRYKYAGNNPLKYTDPDGHFIVAAAAVVGGVIAAKLGALSVGYLGVKAAEKVATIKSDATAKQNASQSVNNALASAAKASGVSTAAALGAVGIAGTTGKVYAGAAALTPEAVAISVIGAAQRPQVAKTIDTLTDLPETIADLPDKAKKAAEKALELTEDAVEQIGPASESQEQNEAADDAANEQCDKGSNGDPDTE